MWGSAPDNVFIASIGGIIVRYNGRQLERMTTGTEAALNGIWGSSAKDVFAAGNGGTILHYDGQAWSRMAGGTEANLTSVWGSSAQRCVCGRPWGHDPAL